MSQLAPQGALAERSMRETDTAMPGQQLAALRATFEFAPMGIAHFDSDGRFLMVNEALCEILGHTREELLRRNFIEITFKDDVAKCRERNDLLLAGEITSYRVEKRFMRSDGGMVWVCVTVALAREGGAQRPFFIAIAEDITERQANESRRRAVEERLRASELEFRALANSIHQMVWIADSDGRRSWFNERWYAYTGLDFESSKEFGWHRAHHPDHGARAIAAQLESFRRGVEWEDSFPLRAADGEYRWFLSRAIPIRDDDGTVVRWFGTNTDVTAQIETLNAAEKAKRQREEMVAVVAHDLRNPLHTLALGCATLKTAKGLDEVRRDRLLNVMQGTAINMGKLLDDLLDISRIDSGTLIVNRARVEPARLFDAVLELFESRAIELGIALDAHAEPHLPSIHADHDRLMQVLSNIVGNALKFTPRGGRVALSCHEAGGALQFNVQDSGCGVPQATLPRLFDRFWKADPGSRHGAGLGLAIARGIVEAHGGRIWAESEPGQGATIRFAIPTC